MTEFYTTVAGDMWDGISHKVYGSSAHMGALMAHNRALSHLVVFPAGVILEIPEIARQAPGGLPPWKQAGTACGQQGGRQ